MIHHCKAVARGSKTPFIVGDMPFGSYQVSKEKAIENAIRFVQEGQVEVSQHFCDEIIFKGC
jgi:3-methyl-2-oxobutanoate hydroxymethyltransferase